MIVDCVNFFNEFDLLDLRLNELNDVVDKVVLVESTVTFTNQPKPLYFQENKKRFKKFLPKIIHVVVKDSPNVSMPWVIEHFQFAAVSRGLKRIRGLKKTDTILLSCTDELPKKEQILQFKNAKGKHKAFEQRVCQYALNIRAMGKDGLWPCTQMFRYGDLLSYTDPYIARFSPINLLIKDGGWHFTNVGDPKRIQQKLAAFSHQEYNNGAYNTAEYIQRMFLSGKDFLGLRGGLEVAPMQFLPQYVQQHPQAYADLIFHGALQPSPLRDLYLIAKQRARVGARTLRTHLRAAKLA